MRLVFCPDAILFAAGYIEKLDFSADLKITKDFVAAPSFSIGAKRALSTERFYRPELDILRFMAFTGVFLRHGPYILLPVTAPGWKQIFANSFNNLANASVYGLSLFFFLSSYLITELLLREREKTGSVHLKAFYIRRILRIWPLYYFAVALAIVCGYVFQSFHLNHHEMIYLLLLVGYLGKGFHGSPFGILWSISVEELFYAIWPALAKWGRTFIAIASFVLIPISLALCLVADDIWFNPIVHFLFFATGALAALFLHGKYWQLRAWKRAIAITIGILCWVANPFLFRILPTRTCNLLSFCLADIGCLLLFLGLLHAKLPQTSIIQKLVYLGKISYGLYVFHMFCMHFVEYAIRVALPSYVAGIQYSLMTYVVTFGCTVALAMLSYWYLETPFLKLKERFEFVRSRHAR